MGGRVQPRPDLTPAEHFYGLKAGDRIGVLWTEDARPVPATVKQTVAFGALVTVDPTMDPGWSCGPFDMYVTQWCRDGNWAR